MWRFNALMTPLRANIVGPPNVATQGFNSSLPFRRRVIDLGKFGDMVACVPQGDERTVFRDRNRFVKFARLVGQVIWKTTDVQFGVVITVRIPAIDEHVVSTKTPHVGQRHRLVVERKVWDRPRHTLMKRSLHRLAIVQPHRNF